MTLGFKLMFPWGKPTNFVQKINQNPGYRPKIHTLRKGKRWKAGNIIHFATGVRTKNYFQFKEGICISTQTIQIDFSEAEGRLAFNPKVIIDNKELTILQKSNLAMNDGFEKWEDFCEWFRKEGSPDQIVHWTNFRY